ncbi:NAD-dependent protein deacetylase sirtuin-3, mitochondrial isoform X2 [Dunckerocampus dactyliophorus]|uniref:NAD-dependent protein deacetylase sirtuin-3, mitochondrial isoform X2 n=1 Tax=Dunckerocampus dactyliophorus TaxID=161453 RepID=UPI002404E4CF|nr:NAD-dependent protein deacetylase sirtuin-3, mitochondrial isoform X2 [Dunckerocampus dactyliophorus]
MATLWGSKVFSYRGLLSRISRTVPASGLDLRSLCPCQGETALCRQTSYPWWNAAERPFSHGGGSVVEQQTLNSIAKNIQEQQYKRVVVMAGAGISTPSGIPDFRSPDSGLYDNLQKYNLPYAEAIFEINFFHHNPKPFFALAKELYPGNYLPNSAHYFVRLLHEKGLLRRMYTQNIDGLERLAGIPPDLLVEAHGTFATASCTVCRRKYEGEELRPDLMSGVIPKCPTYLLIVMGTSLKVEPFASLAGAVRGSVPRLLINRDLVGPFALRNRRQCDAVLLGDVVSGIQILVDALGWTQELDALMAGATKKTETKTTEE